MIWIARSGKSTNDAGLEKRLWAAADQFRGNSGLKSREYSTPVLGLIFLRFAEVRFAAQRAKLKSPSTVLRTPSPTPGQKDGVRGCTAGTGDVPTPHVSRRGSRLDEPAAYHAEGILYLPAEARFDDLLNRPQFGSATTGHGVNTPFTSSTWLQDSVVVPPPNFICFGSGKRGVCLRRIRPRFRRAGLHLCGRAETFDCRRHSTGTG